MWIPLETLEHHFQLREHLHELELQRHYQEQHAQQQELLALHHHRQLQHQELLVQHQAEMNLRHINQHPPLDNHDALVIAGVHSLLLPPHPHEEFREGGDIYYNHFGGPPIHETLSEYPHENLVEMPVFHHIAHIWTKEGDVVLPKALSPDKNVPKTATPRSSGAPSPPQEVLRLLQSSTTPMPAMNNDIINDETHTRPPTVLSEVKKRSPTVLREMQNEVENIMKKSTLHNIPQINNDLKVD